VLAVIMRLLVLLSGRDDRVVVLVMGARNCEAVDGALCKRVLICAKVNNPEKKGERLEDQSCASGTVFGGTQAKD